MSKILFLVTKISDYWLICAFAIFAKEAYGLDTEAVALEPK